MRSFDLAALKKHLSAEDSMQVIIRAHLYAEHVLYTLLTDALPKAHLLDIDRLGFATKARLCAAMALIPDVSLPVLVVLNSIRNNYAHKLNYELTRQDVENLLNGFPSYAVDVMLSDEDGVTYTRKTVPLNRVLLVAVSLIEAHRLDFVEMKKSEREAIERLRVEIEKSKKFRDELE